MSAAQQQYYAGANMPQAWKQGRNGTFDGIADDLYDAGNQAYSVMPPPSYGMQGQSNGSQMPGTSGFTPSYAVDGVYGDTAYPGEIDVNDTQNWFALPLDPLLGLAGADVDQTMLGPQIGGTDMLEVLFNDGQDYR